MNAPEWLTKLLRRLIMLSDGRYNILLTIANGQADWTVTPLGEVEK